MKKICRIAAIVLLVLAIGYLALMAEFEGPIRIDITDSARLSSEEQSIVLPWYLRLIAEYDCQFAGTDADGNRYTKFCYTLPEIFESSGVYCIVQWNEGRAIAFIGETRAMDAIDREFPSVQWN